MYCPVGDRRGRTWRECAAAVSAAGRTPVAVAAAERAGAQRPARGRALRAGGPPAEPGLVSPASAARWWPRLDAAQRRRRPRHLLRARSGPLRRAAEKRRRVAAPRAGDEHAPPRAGRTPRGARARALP